MQQLSLAQQAEFQRYGKKPRREQFLCEMEAVMPWAELLSLVVPHYSKGETGRKPVGLAIMLRVYFLQQWFSLSDPAAEDALYESPALRRFVGVGLHPSYCTETKRKCGATRVIEGRQRPSTRPHPQYRTCPRSVSE
jgi:hypothetical protein